MAGLTGLFRRGTTYYMRVVLPVDHPLRAERPTGRVVVSLGVSGYREAMARGVAKRAEIIAGSSIESVRPSSPRHATRQPSVPPVRLRDLHQRWVAAKAVSEDSSRACLRAVGLFEQSVGDVPLHKITRGMGDEFRAWLQKQPTSSKTARDRLVWIKGLLNYATDDLELLTRNPWRGLDIKARTESPRQPWTEQLLEQLFSDPIWSERVIPATRMAGGYAAFWIPILGLYTGARCSELCQLQVDDVFQDGDVWLLRFTDAGQGQKIKTDAARRIVPLHKELIRLGFLGYVQSVRGSSLWPLLHLRSGKPGGYFSGFFGRVRLQLGIRGSVDFHSFRHTARTNMLGAGVQESLIDRLLGHEVSGSTGARVYSHPANQTLLESINALPVRTAKLTPFGAIQSPDFSSRPSDTVL
jgi:integrase